MFIFLSQKLSASPRMLFNVGALYNKGKDASRILMVFFFTKVLTGSNLETTGLFISSVQSVIIIKFLSFTVYLMHT